MRTIPVVFALALTSLAAHAQAEGPPVPPRLAPAVPPPLAAAPSNGDTFEDLGVLSLTFATFSVVGALPICIFAEGSGSIGRQVCAGIAGGMAVGLAATAVSLFVLSGRQHDAWLKLKSAPVVAPSAQGFTLGWAARF